jgi:hypothetical protein
LRKKKKNPLGLTTLRRRHCDATSAIVRLGIRPSWLVPIGDIRCRALEKVLAAMTRPYTYVTYDCHHPLLVPL